MRMKRVFVNELINVHDRIFLTLNNGSLLYYLSEGNTIRELENVKFETNNLPKFCKIINISNHIIMVPEFESFIYDYDFINHRLKKCHIPNVEPLASGFPFCRDAGVIDDTVWILPNSSKCIVSYDVGNGKTNIFNFFSTMVEYDSKHPTNFLNMSIDYDNKNILLFRNGASEHVGFNCRSKEFYIYNFSFSMKYAIYHNGHVVTSPMNSNDTIQIVDLNGHLIKEIVIPSIFFSHGNGVEYWYIRKTCRYLVVCPHSAKAVVLLDDNFNAEFIDVFGIAGAEYNIWDAVDYDGGILLLSENKPLSLFIGNDMNVNPILFETNRAPSVDAVNHNLYQELIKSDLRHFINSL